MFLLAVALYLAAAALLTWLPANADAAPPPEPGSGVRIYVCSNGAHVDLCVPAAAAGVAWREFVPDSDFDIGMYARFYRFGWGDREFYEKVPEWDDLTVPIALRSTFLPTPTAMHVVRLGYEPEPDELIRAVDLTPENYAKLCAHIRAGFACDPVGAPQPIAGLGYEGWNDRFYRGTGHYHLFRTCNEWTARGLRAAGVKMARWAPFPQCVLYHLPAAEAEPDPISP